MDYVLLIKAVCLLATFTICFIGGIIPIKLTKFFPEDKTLSFANCISSGILLGASLIHLLPDAEDITFEGFPLAHLCCGAGFFIALILEKVIFSHEHDHAAKPKQEVSQNELELRPIQSPEDERITKDLEKKSLVPLEHTLDIEDGTIVDLQSVPLEAQDLGAHAEGGHSQEHLTHNTGGYVLFSVLALESFISGSALGVATSNLAVFVVFIAIITHIWAESFALCASFLKAKMPTRKIYKMMLLFSAVTPLGGLFGLALHSFLEGTIAIIISSVLISFAAGTFLYVAIVELVPEEFEKEGSKWQKLNLMLLGFAFMSVLAIWI